jgi:hypothetical protein
MRRRKRNKLIFIFIILLFILFLSYALGYIKLPENSTKDKFSQISIKNLNQNPSNYFEKNISVKGYLGIAGLGYYLEDNEGYTIFIEDNCIEKSRKYDVNLFTGKPNTETYLAKGILLFAKQKNSIFDLGLEYENRISCYYPLV